MKKHAQCSIAIFLKVKVPANAQTYMYFALKIRLWLNLQFSSFLEQHIQVNALGKN